MKSGANLLNYNLYTSAARNVVWGDGTGGSNTMSATANGSTTLNIFGQIPASQDAAVGTYTDSITATVNF
jgi:spore coat protein U-like protein